MPESRVVRRSANVILLDQEEGPVLLNVGLGEFHGLNPVGAHIWELLEEPQSEDALERRVAEDFGIDRERARTDLERFLAGLADLGLVERDPGS